MGSSQTWWRTNHFWFNLVAVAQFCLFYTSYWTLKVRTVYTYRSGNTFARLCVERRWAVEARLQVGGEGGHQTQLISVSRTLSSCVCYVSFMCSETHKRYCFLILFVPFFVFLLLSRHIYLSFSLSRRSLASHCPAVLSHACMHGVLFLGVQHTS